MRRWAAIMVVVATCVTACTDEHAAPGATAPTVAGTDAAMVGETTTPTIPAPYEPRTGFALSPKSYTGSDLPDFLALIDGNADILMHAGGWTELLQPQPSFTVIDGLAQQQGLDSLFVLNPVVAGAAPLTDASRGQLVTALREFLTAHQPAYLGLGNEVNKLADDDPAAFEQVVLLWAEALPVVRELSPDTKVFVTFQYEWLLGLRGGWFGGVEVAEDWSSLDRFPGADVVAFTTYPSLVFDDPTTLPADYYTRIAAHTELPVLFTESGWTADDTLPLLPGSEQEQVSFIDVFATQAAELRAEVLVWSFVFGDQIPQQQFVGMTLRRADGSARPSWDRWLALRG
ncbi:MAG: hypothetical protein Q7V57_14055 [Actinomycetota bacterium]|nr:hypothetical protein [Actinomycetota bacterium]